MKLSRRNFLACLGGSIIWYAGSKSIPSLTGQAALNRLDKWAPNTSNAMEWRYGAGRITGEGLDFGFIISVSDLRITSQRGQQFLVQRQDFLGDQAFVEHIYQGSLLYDASTGTYTFQDQAATELARWQWDDAAGVYHLTVTTPELALSNLILRPHGDLIPEGIDGDMPVGQVIGVPVRSDYHADWTQIEIDGQPVGTARVDMQGLQPALRAAADRMLDQPLRQVSADDDYDHHWFAIAVELEDDSPAWLSGVRIEDAGGPIWFLTIAQGTGPTWQITHALTHETTTNPLSFATLEQQLPPGAGSGSLPRRQYGRKWRIAAPADLLDLEVAVLPGQFTGDAPLSGLVTDILLQEALGLDVTGSVLGMSVKSVRLAAVETSYEFLPAYLPAVLR